MLLKKAIFEELITEMDTIFTGSRLIGESGFVRLERFKEHQYKIFREDFVKKVTDLHLDNELIAKWLIAFLNCYFSESGGVYPKKLPRELQNLIPIGGSPKDVLIYWRTRDHYYIKSGKNYQPTRFTFFENGKQHHILVKPVDLDQISSNLRRNISFSLTTVLITKDQVNIEISAHEGKKKALSSVVNELKDKLAEKGVFIKPEHLKDCFENFLNQKELDLYIPKNPKPFLESQLKIWSIVLGLNYGWSSQDLNKFIYLGSLIIHFFSHFNQQRLKMWKKPKFVLKANYVITLGKLLSLVGNKQFFDLVDELDWTSIMNDWSNYGFISEECTKEEIIDNLSKQNYRNLPLDTAFVNESLKFKILSSIKNLDTNLDGWLIHSENFQALNTIKNKFRGKVQTIYIDPPFNLGGSDQFDYRTNYRNSSWLTLLENRISLAKEFLKDEGVFFLRCDHNGNMLARFLLDEIFGEENFRNELVVKRIVKKGFISNRFPTATDSLFFYSKSSNYSFNGYQKRLSTPKPSSWHDMTSMNRSNSGGKPKRIFGADLEPPSGRGWTFSQERIDKLEIEGRLRIRCSKCRYVHKKGRWTGCPKCGHDLPKVDYLVNPRETEPIDSNWTDIPGYSSTWGFQTENSEQLLERVILSTSNPSDTIMDFFGGSGTTAAVAQKLRRKWICIEMGDHFFSVILPRLKKVLFYDPSGISRDKHIRKIYNPETSGGFFKYYSLETYEQTLHKAFFSPNDKRKSIAGIPSFFVSDLKFLKDLRFDDEGNILNLEELYEGIDIPETLSNMLGKRIMKIKANQVIFEDEEKISTTQIPFKMIKPLLWWI